ncbi:MULTISPECIES: hypothetical protein [unclassified Isoptericola]|uniref:hypothetical protein n=1 Tax=unclassified Isoptericola TaxID=2623355 RepID=UPI0027125F74|nr:MULTISPECIES: hypothetical protein [unclassified Isoptericola]MDO8149681.1 hypothetical protein [Isoptericola sp. b515]MDO8152616.1 hypothetical protein [Isoptericola sp. b408]
MPGFLLTTASSVACAHQGAATAVVPAARVRLGGTPAVLLSSPWTVAGCTFPPPSAGNGPCVTGTFTTGSVRVTSTGQPLALQHAPGQCVPTGTPLIVRQTQPRVRAT